MPQVTERVTNVLVLYVGGTIGMYKNENDVYVPKEYSFTQKIKSQPELHDEDYAENCNIKDKLVLRQNATTILYEIQEYSPLLDSSNMSHKEWIKIAKDIQDNYNNFDGFLILHGTDTLAYTASALSFMLEGLNKTVIVTGSQISIFETRSDAKNNFLTSLIIAGSYRIPEVTIFFSNKLMRGNRTVKYDSHVLDAFTSPNYPALVNVDINFHVNEELFLKPSKGKFNPRAVLDPNVAILYLFPTVTLDLFKKFFEPPIKGVVIMSFGTGNFPSNRKDLLQFLEIKASEEIIVVNVSQCLQGGIGVQYETGKALANIGVVSGYDMTAAAALTKLSYILALPNLNFQQKKQLVMNDLRGELTVPTGTTQ